MVRAWLHAATRPAQALHMAQCFLFESFVLPFRVVLDAGWIGELGA